MPQTWGTFQRFIYGALNQELSLAENHYQVRVGNTRLERYGYDRWMADGAADSDFYSYMGESHVEGLPYPAPLAFKWELQNLEPAVFAKLQAIALTAYANKAPIRLVDGLLAYAEVTPRKRAKVGAYAETVDGIVYYYPLFNIFLTMERPVEIRGKIFVKMTGREASPRSPVPTTQDVA